MKLNLGGTVHAEADVLADDRRLVATAESDHLDVSRCPVKGDGQSGGKFSGGKIVALIKMTSTRLGSSDVHTPMKAKLTTKG